MRNDVTICGSSAQNVNGSGLYSTLPLIAKKKGAWRYYDAAEPPLPYAFHLGRSPRLVITH